MVGTAEISGVGLPIGYKSHEQGPVGTEFATHRACHQISTLQNRRSRLERFRMQKYAIDPLCVLAALHPAMISAAVPPDGPSVTRRGSPETTYNPSLGSIRSIRHDHLAGWASTRPSLGGEICNQTETDRACCDHR